MANLTIYRGTHQIGGCCTEISAGGRRVLLDLGANLPGSDETAPIKDEDLIARVLDGRPADAVLFTHYHGDHCALYQKIAARTPELPMYIGPLARQILMVVTAYIDRGASEKGFPIVKGMHTYRPGQPLRPAPGIAVWPLYVDHSALDAYMFYIEAGGKRILFTGDFRDHGIQGKQLWRMLNAFVVPKGVDILVTEGTMLGREQVSREEGTVLTEQELGQRAAVLFRKHKYNFVLVSSTNLDSIMEFYHNTPAELPFVCDFYQARLIITAMEGMQRRKGIFPDYQASPAHPAIRVLDPAHRKWEDVRGRGLRLRYPIDLQPITEEEMARDGFVLLARKNSQRGEYVSQFEELRDRFLKQDGQIIYSMWDGYLQKDHDYADQNLIDYIGDCLPVHLHTSGHAYVETIAKLIETVQSRVIVPMHTEKAEAFQSIPALAPYANRVRILWDGKTLPLDEM